jgi:uncharacterized membrane protein
VSYPGANSTGLWGINDGGVMVGAEYSGANPQASEDLAVGFNLLKVPNSTTSVADGINNLGVIVGQYKDANQAQHGFVDNAGLFMTLDYPGAASTIAQSISDHGTIVGSYTEANANRFGFVYQNGSFSQLLCPGAVTSLADGINLRTDTILGGCTDSSGNFTPFLYGGAVNVSDV